MAVLDTSGLGFFMPIFSFLFVFVLIYALLAKTKILGENKFVHIFLSLLLAVFFLVRASFVEFVNLSSAWFAIFIVCVFFILLLVAFVQKDVEKIMKPGVAWVLIAILVIGLLFSASSVFGLAFKWTEVQGWAGTGWFGALALVAIAAIVAWVISKK